MRFPMYVSSFINVTGHERTGSKTMLESWVHNSLNRPPTSCPAYVQHIGYRDKHKHGLQFKIISTSTSPNASTKNTRNLRRGCLIFKKASKASAKRCWRLTIICSSGGRGCPGCRRCTAAFSLATCFSKCFWHMLRQWGNTLGMCIADSVAQANQYQRTKRSLNGIKYGASRSTMSSCPLFRSIFRTVSGTTHVFSLCFCCSA